MFFKNYYKIFSFITLTSYPAPYISAQNFFWWYFAVEKHVFERKIRKLFYLSEYLYSFCSTEREGR